MKSILTLLLLAAIGVVSAISSSGNRLLVVLEEAAEQAKYSKFLEDLEGQSKQMLHNVPYRTCIDCLF